MTRSRDDRRRARRDRVAERFAASDVESALDVLELTELAWHDCYGEVSPPDDVVDDVLVLADGDLAGLARAARLAVTDRRDVRLAADHARAEGRG